MTTADEVTKEAPKVPERQPDDIWVLDVNRARPEDVEGVPPPAEGMHRMLVSAFGIHAGTGEHRALELENEGIDLEATIEEIVADQDNLIVRATTAYADFVRIEASEGDGVVSRAELLVRLMEDLKGKPPIVVRNMLAAMLLGTVEALVAIDDPAEYDKLVGWTRDNQPASESAAADTDSDESAPQVEPE